VCQENVKVALMSAIAGIQDNPGQAKVVFRAHTAMVEDVRCIATVRNFATMDVDEPPELGGSNTAPSPVELALVALGTCQEIMYAAYAAVMDVPLDSVQVKLRGYLDLQGLLGVDASVLSGYQNVVETMESRCPALVTLVRSIVVEGKVTINGQRMETYDAAA
jgi:putative redox protein